MGLAVPQHSSTQTSPPTSTNCEILLNTVSLHVNVLLVYLNTLLYFLDYSKVYIHFIQ